MRQLVHVYIAIMHPTAITLIIEDHRALATVLRMLRLSVEHAHKLNQPLEFDEMRAMLFYMDEIPTHVHHANENELLFPRIRERCPPLRPVLDRLQAEHGRDETAVRDLEHSLMAWQYMGHMEVEESYVLPVAMDYLTEADWLELNDAFLYQRGALVQSMSQSHRELFERITSNQTHY